MGTGDDARLLWSFQRLHLDRRNFFIHREASKIKHGIREGRRQVWSIKGRHRKINPIMAIVRRAGGWKRGLQGIMTVAPSNEAIVLWPSIGFTMLFGHDGRIAVEDGAGRPIRFMVQRKIG
jgi:hypothetical protein